MNKYCCVLLMTAALLVPFSAATDADGKHLYQQRCAACHQPTGVGIPGAFPGLGNRLGDIAILPGGKAYLANVLLQGLQGPLVVDGVKFSGVMQSFATFSDKEIADVLNYVLSEFNDVTESVWLSPELVNKERQRCKNGDQPSAFDLRQSLGLGD